MALRSDMAVVEPLPVASGASDEEVLGAVLDHYRQRLAASDEARHFLNLLAIDDATAERFGIGFSDRTLGLRLPGKRWKLGEELRSTLLRLGVYRESGHEHFVGCVVVPIRDRTARIVGLCGRRIDGRSVDLFADGMGRHWFNDEAISEGVLVAPSIFDALAVIGAGHSGVIAAGHPGALTRADARDLAGRGVRSVTLLGGHDREARTRLAREGIECSAVDERLCLTDVLTRSSDRAAALDALLSSAETPEPPIADERPSFAGTEPVVSGDRAELHVEFPTRHWRARTALRASAHDSLHVALSVTDLRSGRFHLDTLDLYQARARSAYVTAAVAELHANAEALRHELAEVIFAIERVEAESEEEPAIVMTDAERSAAIEFLTDPDLLGRLHVDLASLGVVGEATNLLVAYLATISRKADRPFGVVIQSSSAAGKSTLADAIARLIPPEDLVSFSAITGQALYYLGPNDLSHKVLFVSEEQGASRAAYALKLLVTEGRLAIASAGKDPETGQLRTRGYSVEGPVALLMTTTATDIERP
jgi:DNA primase